MNAVSVEDFSKQIPLQASLDSYYRDQARPNAVWTVPPGVAFAVCVPHAHPFSAEQMIAIRDEPISLIYFMAREADVTGSVPELMKYDLTLAEAALQDADTVILTGGNINSKTYLRALQSWSKATSARANSAALAAIRAGKTGSAKFVAVVVDAAEGPNTRYAEWLDLIRFNCRPEASLYGVTEDGRTRLLWEAVSTN